MLSHETKTESFNIPCIVGLLGCSVSLVSLQWIWSGSDHMFYIFCAGNSSVSQFSKGVGCFLFLGRVLCLPCVPQSLE